MNASANILKLLPKADTNNYWPNYLVTNLINCGATVGDAIEAFTPAMSASAKGADSGSKVFDDALIEGLSAYADRLEQVADEADKKNDSFLAYDFYMRLSMMMDAIDWYFWPYGNSDASMPGTFFNRGRKAFRKAIELPAAKSKGLQWINVPFENHSLDGLYIAPRGSTTAPTPVVVHVNGQHSSLHWQFHMGLVDCLAERGIASLMFDHPGTGSARYSLNLPIRADTESYVGAGIDWLENHAASDESRVGLIGGSLGGYRVPRAAAFEPRIKAAVAWGAHYQMLDSVKIDYPTVGPKLAHHGPFDADEQRIVDGLMYWSGTNTLPDLNAAIDALCLEGVMEKITAPLLVVHGSEDQQLPNWHAERTHAEAINSRKSELLLISPEQGGTQHCNWDNPKFALHTMADWLHAELQG